MFRLLRIFTIILSFFFLTGFVSVFSILGPSVTAFTSGNIFKAGAQFMINQRIEKQTGKTSLALIKDEINKTLIKEKKIKETQKSSLNRDLQQLVEKHIKITRKKIEDQNLQKLLKKRMTLTRSKLNLNKITQ
tara:strand:+ start:275 stop:673 length:399 start_codon:yes stop_codon:yes gene_type:complete